jgi:hypothetical protein
MAQTPQAEAIQSLESAKKYLQEQNYPKAQDEINYASSRSVKSYPKCW